MQSHLMYFLQLHLCFASFSESEDTERNLSTLSCRWTHFFLSNCSYHGYLSITPLLIHIISPVIPKYDWGSLWGTPAEDSVGGSLFQIISGSSVWFYSNNFSLQNDVSKNDLLITLWFFGCIFDQVDIESHSISSELRMNLTLEIG